jgi:ketosteroid isomerase-like protein
MVKNDDAAQVNAVFDRYVDAWKHGDVDALGKIYFKSDRLTAIWPDPSYTYPVMGWGNVRKDLLEVMRVTGGMDIEYSPRHIEIYGNTAILTANARWLDLTRPDKPNQPVMADAGKDTYANGVQTTFIFVRQGAKWVLVHEHASVLPELSDPHGEPGK